jgi:hypothetical protein
MRGLLLGMSTASDLIHQAAANLSHTAAILRAASLETSEHEPAAALWRVSQLLAEMVEPLEKCDPEKTA